MGGVWVGSHRPPPAREPETRRLAGRGRWGGHLSGRAPARNWESRGRWTEGVGCSCPPEPDPLCLRTIVVSSTRGGYLRTGALAASLASPSSVWVSVLSVKKGRLGWCTQKQSLPNQVAHHQYLGELAKIQSLGPC